MKVTLYRDNAGQWRWRWVARNGRIIAVSGEGYSELRWAVRGLLAVAAWPQRRGVRRGHEERVLSDLRRVLNDLRCSGEYRAWSGLRVEVQR